MQQHSLLARLDARDRELYLRSVAWDATRLQRAFWRTVTHLGGAPVTIAAALATVALAGAGSVARDAGVHAALGLAVTHLIARILKRRIGRPRPTGLSFEALIAVPTCFSFPSGHAIAASTLAFTYAWHMPAAAPLLFLAAAVVGVSRVRLGVHYPGDVLAGQGIALLGAALVISIA